MLLSKGKASLDMRTAYGDSLVEAGLKYPEIVCVGADTTDSLKIKNFGNKFPERFFNVGIAEANLVSVAAGLAMAGKIAFASTYAAFLPGRCLDQIRNAICYPNLNVKLVVSHAGLTVGPDGASHQQIEDLATMRAIPNMKVLVPSDAISVRKIVTSAVLTRGPVYVRLARPPSEVLYDESTAKFEIGSGNLLRDGDDATLVGCGLMVSTLLKAAEILKEEHSINCRVIDMFTVKPIDDELLEKAAKDTGLIVSVEEHNILGGLGGAVAESVSSRYPVPIERIGVSDVFGESARDEELEMLLDVYGLSPTKVARRVVESVKMRK
ncbi:MAG TPA: transketolase family protein [Nitrososphaeraceae archaeon]|nr:transketolase family protein [Nitrososphaeraceae archaeon]